MGKTKIATIDDSKTEVEVKKPTNKSLKKSTKSSAAKSTGEVEAIETVVRDDGEEGSRRVAAANEMSEDEGPIAKQGTETEPAGPRIPEKKAQKPGKAKPRSKKYQELVKDLDRSKTYPIPEAVDMVKKLSLSKFNGTLEAHINTLHSGIRGLISLPYASGKKLTILVFGKGSDQSGADIVGSDEVIEQINKGKINFDLVITTPEWMPKLAKIARILGPRGLMPNPKNGTITDPSADGLKKSVESFQAGKTEYKTEAKAPVIHLGLGKLDQPTEELSVNIKTLLQTIGKTRIKKVSLSPTIGPSVKVDLTSI